MENERRYIKNIHIEGLFGDRTIEWELRPDVNILGAANGAGKSTILRALYRMLTVGNLEGDRCKRLMSSFCIQFSDDSSYSWKRGEQSDFVVGTKGLIIDYVNSFEQVIADAVRYSTIPNERREADSTYLDELIKEALNKRNEIFAGALVKWLEEKKSTEKDLDWFEQPELKGYNDLAIACLGLFDYSSINNSSLEFETKNKDKIPYTRLSMGQKQLLLLLLKVTNMQMKPAVMIMDEPDLAMHVDWQKKLLKTLHELNPNMQMIVATHAPRLTTGWRDCVKEIGEIAIPKNEPDEE